MRKLLAISILLIGCSSAEDIPFEISESLFVVEGWLTDQTETQYIKLTKTIPFTTNLLSDPISDAEIEVYERNGSNIDTFRYEHNQDGVYYSSDPFGGVAGRSYNLRILLNNGQVITSEPEVMTTISDIDTLYYDFYTQESEVDPDVLLTIYYPVAKTTDPPDQRNFYRWKLYRNDSLFNEPEAIFLVDDRFIDGNAPYNQEFTTYNYSLYDTIKAERMAINQNAFRFLSQLKTQVTSLGTNTAVSPARVSGNLFMEDSNGPPVLGYFGTIAITSRETVISNK